MTLRRLTRFLATLLAASRLLAPEGLAAQDLTATLYGKVMAEDGAVLPGVTITFSSPNLIRGTETRVTAEDGTYRIPALPPGTYTVTAELHGFQTLTRPLIALGAGMSLAIDFVMKVAAIQENVTVVGESPLVDVKNSQATRTVDRSFLQNAPTGRSFADAVVTVPGVLDSEYKSYPAQSVQGSTPRSNNYQVDGAVATDPSGGYMAMEIPYDMLEEVQVTTGGISAEYGEASGAVFNFITKSGGNDLHGGVNVFGQGDKLEWDNLTADLVERGLTQGNSQIKNLEYGFSLGGPIKENRIWYFGNLRWIDRGDKQPDFPARNVTTDDRQGFLKVTAQVMDALKLEGSYTRRDSYDFPSNASFATNDDPRTWRGRVRDQGIANIGGTWILTDHTFVDARFGRSDTAIDLPFDNENSGYQDITSGIFSRGWTVLSGKQFKRDKQGIKGNVSHYVDDWLGKHSIRGGLYAELAEFARISDMPDDTFHLLRGGAPYRVRLFNTPGMPAQSVTTYAGYIQDQWTASDRLTLNIGIRFESTEGWSPEQTRGGGRWFPKEVFPEVRHQINWFNESPRLGFVWSITGDSRTSLRASYGHYLNPLVTETVGSASPAGNGYIEYDWLDTNGDLVFQNGEQGTQRSDTRPGAGDSFDPALRQPYVDAFHLSVERQLAGSLVVSIGGVYKRERDLMEVVSLSLPFSAFNPITVANPLDGEAMTIYALDRAYQGVRQSRMLTNPNSPEPLERNYYGLEIGVRKRMANRWQLDGSVVVGRSEGNLGNAFAGTSGNSGLYLNPNNLINDYGPLDMDSPLNLKLQGTWIAPGDLAISAFYNGISGLPISLSREVNFSPIGVGSQLVRFTSANNPAIVSEAFIDVRGTRRGDDRFEFRNRFSLRAEKRIQIGRFRAGLIADMFNVLNISDVTTVQSLVYGQTNFLRPASIESPRVVRLGARIDF